MTKEEAMQIVKEAIDKIEKEGFTAYDAQQVDNNKGVSFAVVVCLNTCIFIQAIEGIE